MLVAYYTHYTYMAVLSLNVVDQITIVKESAFGICIATKYWHWNSTNILMLRTVSGAVILKYPSKHV